MAKKLNGYTVSDAEFARWKNGNRGARPSAPGGMSGSGCLIVTLALPVAVVLGALRMGRRHV